MDLYTLLRALAAATLLLAAPFPAAAQSAAPEASRKSTMEHLSVEILGTSGTPVILIPGLGSPREVWRGIAPELAQKHRVYLIQVNGFAGSDPAANLRPGILPGIVANLRQLIQEQSLDKPAVIGHSMGGLVGLMLAARHPESVGRLMVVDALPFYGVLLGMPGIEATVATVEPRAAQLRDAIAATYGKPADIASADANVASLTLKSEHRPSLRNWWLASDPRAVAQAMYEDMITDMRPELGRVRASVTVIHAWTAAFPGREAAAAFYRQQYAGLAGVTIADVGESGHFVMLDQPAAFAAEVDKFLR